MRQLTCTHCSGTVKATDETCPNCGIPLAPDHAKKSQKSFILFFIGIVIFCAIMVILVPQLD